MEATLIVIDSDAELARTRALVDRLMAPDKPTDVARLAAQARLIAAYEEEKWPPRSPSAAEVIRYLMDQHGLKRADLVPLLGGAERRRHLARPAATDLGDGAAIARPLPRAGRPAAAAGPATGGSPRDKRGGRVGAILRSMSPVL
jgi:antitoxin component HigA of HigAB toxin-antitoxin module